MRNTKTLGIAVALGLGLTFLSPFGRQARAVPPPGDEAESMAGGLPALEERVQVDEGLISDLTTRVTTLEGLVATALHRLSAEFQNKAPGSVGGEVITSAGVPGVVVYDKTLSIPFPVAYITFSAQGDTHGGSALLMTASVKNADGTKTTCQPMANAGGAALIGAPWMTLMKLPTDGSGGANNCNDGGGGSADCHNNAFSFSCCVLTTPAASGATTQDVQIKMASSDGTNQVFYEDSTIYIDASSDPTLCTGVSTAAH